MSWTESHTAPLEIICALDYILLAAILFPRIHRGETKTVTAAPPKETKRRGRRSRGNTSVTRQ